MLVAGTVAGVASFMDWQLNPGGIFHGAAGTNWSIVWATWASWFAPVFLLVAVLLIPALVWYTRR